MSEKTSSSAVATVTEPKLSVVMNGGSDTLESARIPVQFGVNAALAEIQPTHVLVIIQHKSEVESNTRGIRKLIPLSRGSDFICFESAGEHTVTFIALKIGEDTINTEKRFNRRYLSERKPGVYGDYIVLNGEWERSYKHGVIFENRADSNFVVAVFRKTINLPEELFAKKSKTWVWKWVNLLHHYDPVDECSYRRRAIYAFTLKPIFMLILVTIALVVRYGAAVIASLWLIMAKLTVFILGWRPEPIFKDFGRIWNIKTESPCEIDWDITTGDNYGVWDYQKGQFYPVTGGAIILSTLAISMLLVLCATLSEILCNAELKHELAPWAFSAILLGVLTLIAFWALSSWTKLQWIRTCRDACKAWYVKKWPKKSPQITPVPVKVEEKKELLKPTYYFEWLKSSLNADQLPKRVDLAKVPTAFKQPTIHKFRLSFNAMKAKVCKPFPRH